MDFSVLSFKGLRLARNLHPLFVHFPLALLPTSFCFYLIGCAARRREYLFAGRAVLFVALAAVLPTFFTGFRAEATLGISDPTSTLLRAHLAFGSVLTAATIFLFAWSRAHVEGEPRIRWAFLATLGVSVALAMLTGDLGAQLVYLKGASVRNPPLGGPPR